MEFPTVLCLLVSTAVVLMQLYQAQELKRLREALDQLRRAPIESLRAEPLPEPSLLEGLRVSLSIQQDHERPTLELLLKERLEAEGASVVAVEDSPDVFVEGNLVCNGYAEIFFDADLKCRTGSGTVTLLNEKPLQGGRQLSLATELIARLKRDLSVMLSRKERLQALNEMGLGQNLRG